MSVTFSSSMGTILGWDVQCVCGASYLAEGQELLSYDEAAAVTSLVKKQNKGFINCEDEDCFTFGIHPEAVVEGGEGPFVSMSNINSVNVLQALGLMTDKDDFAEVCCGELSAEDFKGRALMALAVAPMSAERMTEVSTFENGSVFVACGVEEGYVQRRLEALLEVADFALSQGRSITWS